MPTHQTRQTTRLAFDIFCQVIDNFGDIGVSWRLARQLAHAPHHAQVRLWVDDLERFQRLEPTITTSLAEQCLDGVSIMHWCTPAPPFTPHDVVIEAFGCDLPHDVITAMKARNSLWVNLEYLSAEPWVSGFHLQRSVQANGLRKYFYFPGFTPGTGGLLREPDLEQRRLAWLSQPERRDALLRSSGVCSADIAAVNHDARLVFLFCYPDAPVRAMIRAFAQEKRKTVVLIPNGVYPQAESSPNGNVRVYHIPFVSHADFDHLLWSADLNIVRGEDSMVRALWAARPMIWQPYRQDDDAHLTKLDAWLAQSPFDPATRTLVRSWTTGDDELFGQELVRHLQPDNWTTWSSQSTLWAGTLRKQTDLVTALISFCAQHR